jgi:hypothetical protein
MNKPEDSFIVLTLIDMKRMVNIVERNIHPVYFPVEKMKSNGSFNTLIFYL